MRPGIWLSVALFLCPVLLLEQGPILSTPPPNTGLPPISPDRPPIMPTWLGVRTVKYFISPGNFGTIEPAIIQTACKEVFSAWTAVAPTLIPTFEFGGEHPETEVRRALAFSRKSIADRNFLFERTSSDEIYVLHDQFGIMPQQDGANSMSLPVPGHPSRFGVGVAVFPTPAFRNIQQFRLLLAHEVGHLLGLSHAMLMSRSEVRDEGYGRYPSVMVPILSLDTPATPQIAESTWLKYLYQQGRPSADYGTIWGTLTDVSKAGHELLSGINLVAESIDPIAFPDGSRHQARFSGVTGYNGEDGMFLLVVRPGRYRIFGESFVEEVQIKNSTRSWIPAGGSLLGPRVRGPNGYEHIPPAGEVSRRELFAEIKVNARSAQRRDLTIQIR